MAKTATPKKVVSLNHDEAKRKNIPTAEYQSVLQKDHEAPRRIKYPRNADLDPQLVWRGKDERDWTDLVVYAPPLYIQEKVHPKVLIDDLLRASKKRLRDDDDSAPDLFADFNGMPKGVDRTEFYQHDQNWSNRMILGDSLQVMASLTEREGLRGKVQCIYVDPPYGIKFNSNFQWSTTSRDVKDGNKDHITREPEQVKAFRDTWRNGIHSYLTYLRDRLTVARDLLTDSGSIFVQIGDENVHRVRAVMDEVFGDKNILGQIAFLKTSGSTTNCLAEVFDYILWYGKCAEGVKYRSLFRDKNLTGEGGGEYRRVLFQDSFTRPLTDEERDNPDTLPEGARIYRVDNLTSQSPGTRYEVAFSGKTFYPTGYWKTQESLMKRLVRAGRVEARSGSLGYIRFLTDYPVISVNNFWSDTRIAGRPGDKTYVVQTLPRVIERCLLMASDPGDLVLDPTCGSGTTAYVAEQWGRRWITIDTSRVALALARARIMGARYPYYVLADSLEGQRKEAEISRTAPSSQPVYGNIRHGFVYERVPHITLKSIVNNTEIDVICEKWQGVLEPLREALNAALGERWEEWQVPRQGGKPWPNLSQSLFHKVLAEQERGEDARRSKIAELMLELNTSLKRNYTTETLPDSPADPWPDDATRLHAEWWQARVARQKEIDASIAAKAELQCVYDRPYEDKRIVRVAGPLTVESLSPHRVLSVDEDDELIDTVITDRTDKGDKQSFPQMILENLKLAGVQQAHKENRINFTALTPWPGDLVCAEGRYMEGETEKRAAIVIGPEFGTVQRADLVAAAREAGDANFDVLITCAFNYEAHATDFNKLGRIAVLKARMNADLHMADDLKSTGKGNLFVVFGEPDVTVSSEKDSRFRVKVNGVDVFKPQTGEVISDNADGIACWFVDTDYNEESFFVRHAYFLGANDPYNGLKTTLKADIDHDAWATLHSDISRPFDKPSSGRIAVKVINHLGDEVMKVFKV
jgi:adenine-specific DNA-methyltransferase